MPIIKTDLWLENHFNDPIEICDKILNENRAQKPQSFYHYLLKFGMYKPNRQTESDFRELKQENIWKTVEELYKKYHQKWQGPDIPVYIFPQGSNYRPAVRSSIKKSGLSFSEMLFLFLTPELPKKEIEALIVHEYHHICRMKKSKKDIKDYTLLDSIIIEGLAENAVEECCGKDYLAKWCHLYSNDEILYFWNRYLKKNLSINRGESLHDPLLFGRRGIPTMLGYAAGYTIVSKYKKENPLKWVQTFTLNSEEFLNTSFLTPKN